jgi:hypothetical protein
MVGSFWLLAGRGHDYEVSAGQLPLFAAFGQNYVASAAGRLSTAGGWASTAATAAAKPSAAGRSRTTWPVKPVPW